MVKQKPLTVAFFCFILVGAVLGSYEQHKEFVCSYTRDPVKLDGRLDEWKNASSIKIWDETGESDNAVRIYSLWDEKNLYFAFDVIDLHLEAKQTERDHAELYRDDMVEFLIDSRNDKDSCWTIDDIIYHINILGHIKDDRGTANCVTDPGWNGEARYSIQTDGSINRAADKDKGYVVEISVPWQEIQIKPSAGEHIGVNFGNGDNGRLFDWVNASPFRSPHAFGNLILSRRK